MKSSKSAKIWILNPFTNKVMRVDESDPRIAEKRDTDLAWFRFAEHPTLEDLRSRALWHRRTSHDEYRYAVWGSTEEELCGRYNKRFDDAIKRLRAQIKDLEVQIEDAESRKMEPSGIRSRKQKTTDDRCSHCKEFDKDGCPNCGPDTIAKVF